MDYSNPEIPDGINTSKENPLKEFLVLTIGVFGAIVLVVIILSLMAERFAIYIPFPLEQQLIPDGLIEQNSDDDINNYLQNLSDQLSQYMDLPEDMDFIIHYSKEPIENAYATIGGHIYIYQGLIDLLPNENALAMVIAHEMAHVYHRHPIIAMGRGVVIGLLLSALSGFSGDYFIGKITTDAGVITLLNFNRDQERVSDETALAIVAAHYGHVKHTDKLFRILLDKAEANTDVKLPQFLSTHPLGENRIKNIQVYARENNLRIEGKTTALPDFVRH